MDGKSYTIIGCFLNSPWRFLKRPNSFFKLRFSYVSYQIVNFVIVLQM